MVWLVLVLYLVAVIGIVLFVVRPEIPVWFLSTRRELDELARRDSAPPSWDYAPGSTDATRRGLLVASTRGLRVSWLGRRVLHVAARWEWLVWRIRSLWS